VSTTNYSLYKVFKLIANKNIATLEISYTIGHSITEGINNNYSFYPKLFECFDQNPNIKEFIKN
jgi:hypothetical protein